MSSSLDASTSHAWHAIPFVNPRPLSVDGQFLFPIFVRRHVCRTSLYCSEPHVCSSPRPVDPRAAIRQTPFFVLERRSTPSARRPMPRTFPSTLRPLRSQTVRLSAPPMAALTRAILALHCVLYSFATHLGAHVGLPCLPLVGLRPSCLNGCPSSLT